MPYVVVDGRPIHLWPAGYKRIREQALSGYPPPWRLAAAIAGSPENRRTQKLLCDCLKVKTLARVAPAEFEKEFATFHFQGDEARTSLGDLIFDWLHWTGLGHALR